MSDQPTRILITDDEAPIRMTMEAILRRRGYDVTTADSGEAALALLHERPFDVLLLDLRMPGMSGSEVAQRARTIQPDVEILILTGHGSLDSAIEGIEAGVFAYMLKTSNPQHVIERVAAAVAHQQETRRQPRVMNAAQGLLTALGDQPAAPKAEPESGFVAVGDLEIIPWTQTVRRAGETVTLTPTEFRVLSCLAQQAGRVMSFVEIARCAQGYATDATEAAELVKPHISHLRQKLEPDPANPRYLLTVRGTGYMLKVPEKTG